MVSEEELVDYLSRLHCQNPLPEAVLIENVHCYHRQEQVKTPSKPMMYNCT